MDLNQKNNEIKYSGFEISWLNVRFVHKRSVILKQSLMSHADVELERILHRALDRDQIVFDILCIVFLVIPVRIGIGIGVRISLI